MTNGNITLITREPVAGELRPHTNEYGIETVQVYDGERWLDFAQPTYESLLAENARLREEVAALELQLHTTLSNRGLRTYDGKAQE